MKKITALLLCLSLMLCLFAGCGEQSEEPFVPTGDAPGSLPEKGIGGGEIKGMGKRAFRFFFSGDAGPGGDHRGLFRHEALTSPFIFCHKNTFFCFS